MNKVTILPLLAFVITCASCRKNNDENTDTDLDKLAIAINGLAEISGFSHALIEGNPAEGVACATLTTTTGTRVLDFGNVDCTDSDGFIRSGMLTVTNFEIDYNVGDQYTVEAKNYKVDDFLFNGNYTFTVTAVENGVPVLNGLSDFTIRILETNRSITYASNEVHRIAEGGDDSDPFNNVIQISGTAGGNTGTGLGFDLNITEAINHRFDCHYITQGRMDITSDSFEKRILDYGEGCDARADLLIGTTRRYIYL